MARLKIVGTSRLTIGVCITSSIPDFTQLLAQRDDFDLHSVLAAERSDQVSARLQFG
jgi:hypothetical protein